MLAPIASRGGRDGGSWCGCVVAVIQDVRKADDRVPVFNRLVLTSTGWKSDFLAFALGGGCHGQE